VFYVFSSKNQHTLLHVPSRQLTTNIHWPWYHTIIDSCCG